MTHIPYRGQAPTTTAVIAGEVQLLITTPSGAMNEFIAQKRLKLLAVTVAEPSPLAPGHADHRRRCCRATPPRAGSRSSARPACRPTVVAKLNDAITPRCSSPRCRRSFTTFGVIAKTTTPQKLGQMIAEEVARWSQVVRDNNIRAD